MTMEAADAGYLGDRVEGWLASVLESSPPAVQRAAASFSRWAVLQPPGVLVTDLGAGHGRTADFPAAAEFLRAAEDFAAVMVEDRLSRGGDPYVYSVEAVPEVPDEPVSVDLERAVFTVASAGPALARIVQGMSHWQFPALLMLRTAPDTATLKRAVVRGRISGVAGVVISCCDGETVLVSH
ncbi:hypothetical protein AB0K15_04380 [Amycolatopsis sp. NPDC049253]|uniref:hypothetical protein n=1 Tax=Amycolatopsis sp. NPDC049253 TaxID=3155274 RepID=UPI00342071CB